MVYAMRWSNGRSNTGLLPSTNGNGHNNGSPEHGTAEEQAQIDLYLGRAYEDGEYDKNNANICRCAATGQRTSGL